MKKVRIISTQSDSVKTVETSATTWGNLKSELSEVIDNINNMKAIVRETRNTLESDLSLLPDGDFTLILTMKKIASGSDENPTRYSKSQILEIRTKILNLLDDLLDYQDEKTNENKISEEEKQELEKLREEGLI